LTFIDIDDAEKAPDTLLKNTQDTFCVSSPSVGGEHRYILSKNVPNIKRDWGEIRATNQYVVGPGSVIPDYHENERGIYEIKDDREIIQVKKSDLEEWVNGFDTNTTETTQEVDPDTLPDIDTNTVDYANACIREFQQQYPNFFGCLMDRLNGGRGQMGDSLNRNNSSKINRSSKAIISLSKICTGLCSKWGRVKNARES